MPGLAADEERADLIRDRPNVFFEREMARVVELDLRAGNIALVRLGTGNEEDRITASAVCPRAVSS